MPFACVDKLLLIGAVALSKRAPQHENMIEAVKAAEVGHVVYVSFHRKEKSKINLREVTDVEIKSEKDTCENWRRLHNRQKHPLHPGIQEPARRQPQGTRRSRFRPGRKDNLREH